MEQETVQRAEKKEATKPNLTGIPTQMKLDFEQRSGLSFDDVRVHYNSDKPARLQALAYTQGAQVYVGPGQEQHLPHELGHIVQQKLGLVRPTMRMGNVLINDDPHLERGADTVAKGIPHTVTAARAAEGVVQKKGVAVSLYTPVEIPAREYMIDTIKITDRFATGLPNQSQGDHTIADALIKKYQKVQVKNVPVETLLFFYEIFAQDIINVNTAFTKVGPGNNPKRAKKAVSEANGVLASIESFPTETLPARDVRKDLIPIISKANSAYSHSVLATFGTGSGGKNERQGMAALRNFNGYAGDALPMALSTLIDYDSIRSLGAAYSGDKTGTKIVNLIEARFIGILNEIGQRKGMPEVTLDDIRQFWADTRAAKMIGEFQDGWKKLQNDCKTKLENGSKFQSDEDVQIDILRAEVVKLIDDIMPKFSENDKDFNLLSEKYGDVVDWLTVARKEIAEEKDPDYCLVTNIDETLMEDDFIKNNLLFLERVTLGSLPTDVYRLITLFISTTETKTFDYTELEQFFNTDPAKIYSKIKQAITVIGKAPNNLYPHIKSITAEPYGVTVEVHPKEDVAEILTDLVEQGFFGRDLFDLSNFRALSKQEIEQRQKELSEQEIKQIQEAIEEIEEALAENIEEPYSDELEEMLSSLPDLENPDDYL